MAIVYRANNKGTQTLSCTNAHHMLQWAFDKQNQDPPVIGATNDWIYPFYVVFKDWPEDNYDVPEDMSYATILKQYEQIKAKQKKEKEKAQAEAKAKAEASEAEAAAIEDKTAEQLIVEVA